MITKKTQSAALLLAILLTGCAATPVEQTATPGTTSAPIMLEPAPTSEAEPPAAVGGTVTDSDMAETEYSEDLEITFPDKNLEAVIREMINKKEGAIYVKDTASISFVFASGKEIKSIEGLQYFKNLMGVNLSNNQIEDIDALIKLKNLSFIELNNNAKDEFDVAGFAGHTQLTLYCNKRIYSFPSEISLPAKPYQVPDIYRASGENIDYLILLDNELLIETADQFYSLKKSQGYETCIELAGNIPAKNKNRTEDIRNYLLEMDKKHDLKYVLLIGAPYDAYALVPDNTGGNIPMKYFYHRQDDEQSTYDGRSVVYVPEENYYVSSANFPTDLYYAFDIDWNQDRDEYTGEAGGIDYHPNDIKNKEPLFALGRIPFSDKESVQIVLSESIDAQTNYINNPKEELTALIGAPMLGFIEVEFKNKIKNPYFMDKSREGEVIRENLRKAGIETTTLYEKEGIGQSPFECTYPLNIQNFMNEFIKGYDIVFSNGHGGIERRILTADKNGNGYIDKEDTVDAVEYWDCLGVENARNTFTFLDACSTGLTEGPPAIKGKCNIASLMKARATVCGVGSTRDSGASPQFDYDCISVFFLCDSKMNSFGNLFYSALVKRIAEVLEKQGDGLSTVLIFNYFGDPSISCRPEP